MQKSFIHYLFTVVFFFIIVLPLLLVNRKEGAISAAENRVLASPAKFYLKNGEINKDYFNDVSKWFDDNIGLRDLIVRAEGLIRYYIFNEIENVPLGPSGELAVYSTLEDYQHKNLLTEAQLTRVIDAFSTIEDYLESQQIQVYYMQCWDKQSIYPEQYPDTIKVFGKTSKTDQVEKALIDNHVMNVIPIKNKLISLKTKYNLYGTWADPWHWVQRGAFVAYQELITRINSENNGKYKELTENDFDIEMRDIGKTYYGVIHKKDIEEVFTLKYPYARNFPDKLENIPEGVIPEHTAYYINNAVDNDDTVLVLGDSYFINFGVVSNLAESFHKTIAMNGTGAQHGQLINIIDTYNPDIVIFENAERCNYRFDEAIGTADVINQKCYVEKELVSFASADTNALRYIVNGFWQAENGFTWTRGEAKLFFYCPNMQQGHTHCVIDLADVYTGKQAVIVYINGDIVYEGVISTGEDLAVDFDMPDTKMVTLKIEMPEAISPFDRGESEDYRKLGMQMVSLSMYSA